MTMAKKECVRVTFRSGQMINLVSRDAQVMITDLWRKVSECLGKPGIPFVEMMEDDRRKCYMRADEIAAISVIE